MEARQEEFEQKQGELAEMEGLTLLQSDGQQAAEETGEGSVEKAPQA